MRFFHLLVHSALVKPPILVPKTKISTTRSSGGEAPCVCQTQEVSIEVENCMLVTFGGLAVQLLLCRFP